MTRKIIHVDMDAFYASVEQRDHPELRGRPVIVGGAPEKRGVVAAASYEARVFGVHSAMPGARAARLCPEAVFVRPRFDEYRAVSRQIQAIFLEYTPLVEPLSLDEAYLDVSNVEIHQGSATRVAREIKQRIHERTGLTASAGVSYNKLIAKLGSDMDKPDGLTVITPQAAPAILRDMPVKKLPGVGPATAAKMAKLGITHNNHLLAYSTTELARIFGRVGPRFKQMAVGIDERPVRAQRTPKSIGAETTFASDMMPVASLLTELAPLTQKVAQRLQSKKLAGRTVTLKLKYANFELVTRAQGLDTPVADARAITAALPALLARTEAGDRAVRLIGVTVSRLESAEARLAQPRLFADAGW